MESLYILMRFHLKGACKPQVAKKRNKAVFTKADLFTKTKGRFISSDIAVAHLRHIPVIAIADIRQSENTTGGFLRWGSR